MPVADVCVSECGTGRGGERPRPKRASAERWSREAKCLLEPRERLHPEHLRQSTTALLITIASSSNPDWWFQSCIVTDGRLVDGCQTDGWKDGCGSSDGEAQGARQSQEAPKREIIPTLHPTDVFFFFFYGGGTNFHQVCFSTRSHNLQTQGRITGLVTDRMTLGRQLRKGGGVRGLVGETVWQTQHHLVASAGHNDQVYGWFQCCTIDKVAGTS